MLIVKGHPARLPTQSEQFANELTRHLGICAPDCRILRKVVWAASSDHLRSPETESDLSSLLGCMAAEGHCCARHDMKALHKTCAC